MQTNTQINHPFQLFAVNATAVRDNTPKGSPTYKIQLDESPEMAIDRVQKCTDFSYEQAKVLEKNVFRFNSGTMLAFRYLPVSNNAVLIVTASCEQSLQDLDIAIKLLFKALEKALDHADKIETNIGGPLLTRDAKT